MATIQKALTQAMELERQALTVLGNLPAAAKMLYPQYVKNAEQFSQKLTEHRQALQQLNRDVNQ